MAVNELVVRARARTSRSRESAFQSLVAAPPLRWIEAPWVPRSEEALTAGQPFAWYLANGRRLVTQVEIDDGCAIRWNGDGIIGEVQLASGDGETDVSYSGVFPLVGGGLSGFLFCAVMKGKMSRLASEETEESLRRVVG